MTVALRVNVITSCTGRKVTLSRGEKVAAERLYCGQQHLRLMRGVDRLRATIARNSSPDFPVRMMVCTTTSCSCSFTQAAMPVASCA